MVCNFAHTFGYLDFGVEGHCAVEIGKKWPYGLVCSHFTVKYGGNFGNYLYFLFQQEENPIKTFAIYEADYSLFIV
jgi:hypothetical protein